MNLHEKKKWVFKQSTVPTLATLAGAANGLRPLVARGLAGINKNSQGRKLTQNKIPSCGNLALVNGM